MRALALAAGLVAASACCVDVAKDDACVVDRLTARPYCYALETDVVHCWDGSDEPAHVSADLRVCEGTVQSGDDCSDHGFTVSCGDYWVRPGDRC